MNESSYMAAFALALLLLHTVVYYVNIPVESKLRSPSVAIVPFG